MEEQLFALWDRKEVEMFRERFNKLTEDLPSERQDVIQDLLTEFHVWIQNQSFMIGVLG